MEPGHPTGAHHHPAGGFGLAANRAGDFYRQLALKLRVGDELPLEEVVAHLESIGYQRREPVEMVGEYSVRGGILDVFSPEAPKPIRLDLFGDQVESIRRFDVESQRSVLKIEDCTLLPLTEWQKSRALLVELGERMREAGFPAATCRRRASRFPAGNWWPPCSGRATASVFSLLERPIVLWDEPEQVRGATERFWKRLEQIERSPVYDPDRIYFHWEELERQAGGAPQMALRELDIGRSPGADSHIPTRPSLAFHGNMQVAIAEARTLVESGNRVAFFASSTGEVERVADILNEYRIPYQLGLEQFDSTPAYLAERAYVAGSVASIYLVKGLIRHGAAFPDSKLVVFGSEDLFETSEMVARAPASKSALATFGRPDRSQARRLRSPLRARRRPVPGPAGNRPREAKGDYMLLEYAAGARLYVPLTRMDLVQRFRGAGKARHPWTAWAAPLGPAQKRASKPKCATWPMSCSSSTPREKWPRASSFRWIATGSASSKTLSSSPKQTTRSPPPRDQAGHGKPQPMDRLVCGDVGFGKTEVVMRAAFKALGDGKQVAYWPLLQYSPFSTSRPSSAVSSRFPVRVEMFSRFRIPKELKASLEDLAEGKVDVAIGTHRLLI